MLRSARIALAFLRIPHLAVSLFIFPLVMSLGIVIVQLLVTGVVVKLTGPAAEIATTATSSESNSNPIRWLLYGSGEPRPTLKVCRWVSRGDDAMHEEPPEASCSPDRLDVALQVENPMPAYSSNYLTDMSIVSISAHRASRMLLSPHYHTAKRVLARKACLD